MSAEAGRSEVLGVVCMLAAILVFTAMDALAKHLGQHYDPVQVAWARFMGQAVTVTLILAPRLRFHLRTSRLLIHLARSAIMLLATISFFIALSLMPIGEATAIFLVEPLIVVAFAALLLKEKTGPRRWVGVAIGLTGALIVLRPGVGVFSPVALLPLVAACGYAAFALLTRYLNESESVWTTLFYTGSFGAVITCAVVPFYWSPIAAPDIPLMICIGVVGTGSHLLLILGLRYAEASLLAPLSYTGLVWAILIGIFLFDEIPDGWTLAGSALIILAGLYVWRRSQIAAAPQAGS